MTLKEDKHELVKITDEHFVVKNVSIDPRTAEFNYYNVWIDRKSYITVAKRYFLI